MLEQAEPLELGKREAGEDDRADRGEGDAEDGPFRDDAFDAAGAGLRGGGHDLPSFSFCYDVHVSTTVPL